MSLFVKSHINKGFSRRSSMSLFDELLRRDELLGRASRRSSLSLFARALIHAGFHEEAQSARAQRLFVMKMNFFVAA